MNIVMLVKNSFEYDARVTKEARSLIEQGHEVTVVAILVPDVTPEHELREDGIRVRRVTRVNLGVDAMNELAQRFSLFIERRRARMTGTEADERTALREGSLGLDSTATPGASTMAPGTSGVDSTTATTDVVTTGGAPTGVAGRVEATDDDRQAFYVEWSTAVLRTIVKLIKFGFKVAKVLLGKQGQGFKHYAINRRFIAAAAELEPDVVHCHDLNTLWSGRKVKEATGCKLVYDSHEMATARNRMGLGWRLWCEFFEKRGIVDADAVIMASPGYADVARARYGVDATVIINVPEPQEPTGTRDLRAETGVEADHTLLIYQGSIQENRGIEQVIDAVELLNRDIDGDDGVSFVIVGYGYHRAALEDLVEERRLAGVVKFFGPVPNPELVDWSSSADIGMCNIVGTSPSYRESLPNKFFEYVMAGVPVVVSDFGSMGRICQEEGVGVTCDPTDPRALADAVTRLRDPEFYERCRANTPAMAAKYNWGVEQRKLIDLYDALATNGAVERP